MLSEKQFEELKSGQEIEVKPTERSVQFQNSTFEKEIEGGKVMFRANGNGQVVSKSIFMKYASIPGEDNQEEEKVEDAEEKETSSKKRKKRKSQK